jgi:hypothetical protein
LLRIQTPPTSQPFLGVRDIMLCRLHPDTCGVNATMAKSQRVEAYEGRASLVQARLAIAAIVNGDRWKNVANHVPR